MRVITMIVKARSMHESIEVVDENTYITFVKSTPERGRATKDSLKLLSRHLRVPFAKLMLSSNDALASKTVCVLD